MVDFSKYRMNNILDIAHIERAVSDKIYPAGSIKIQLSATRGKIEFMEKQEMVESKYAVVEPFTDIDKKYLFISIQSQWERFLHKYKTGLNIQIEILKQLNVPIHNKETQKYIVNAFEIQEQTYQKEYELVNAYKDMKKTYLKHLFV